MKAAIISFSAQGETLAERIAQLLVAAGDLAESSRCAPDGLQTWTAAHFAGDALIFVGSCGIAVRAIAPLLEQKTSDPAVVVVDECATYVISLLSGHIGGANALASRLAAGLGATAVITTATDRRGLFSVDSWAIAQGLRIATPERIRVVSARLLAGQEIRIDSCLPFDSAPPPGVKLCHSGGDISIDWQRTCDAAALQLVPPLLTLGVGCRRGVTAGRLEALFQQILHLVNCHPLAVARVCSIDLKAGEAGLLEFCQQHDLPLATFSPAALMALPGCFAVSDFVMRTTGADNICERSAILGAGKGARLLQGKMVQEGVTMALAIAPPAAYVLSFAETKERRERK